MGCQLMSQLSIAWLLRSNMTEPMMVTILSSLIAVILVWIYRNLLVDPHLEHIPGPFVARLSSLYRVYLLWSGLCDEKFENLHRRFGSVVRLGPNHVTTSDPDTLLAIYCNGWRFPKVTALLEQALEHIINPSRASSTAFLPSPIMAKQ